MALDPGQSYRLAKSIWTDKDFEQMGWHDNLIHAFSYEPDKCELAFDLDYIFAWVNPNPPSVYFSFWISPVTLIFHNAWSLHSEMDEPPGGILIMGVERDGERCPPKYRKFAGIEKEWRWKLDLLNGEMSFFASGYSQFTRREPIHVKSGQSLSLEERGGISFERPALDL